MWTLEEAQEHLAAWLAADKAAATGQSYKIDDRQLTRADVPEIRRQINFWSAEVQRLLSGRRPGARVFRAVPVDR